MLARRAAALAASSRTRSAAASSRRFACAALRSSLCSPSHRACTRAAASAPTPCQSASGNDASCSFYHQRNPHLRQFSGKSAPEKGARPTRTSSSSTRACSAARHSRLPWSTCSTTAIFRADSFTRSCAAASSPSWRSRSARSCFALCCRSPCRRAMRRALVAASCRPQPLGSLEPHSQPAMPCRWSVVVRAAFGQNQTAKCC